MTNKHVHPIFQAALAPFEPKVDPRDPESNRFVVCDACHGEGRKFRTEQVYERGCGFSHDDAVDDGPCAECDGTGHMEIEVEAVTQEDLVRSDDE